MFVSQRFATKTSLTTVSLLSLNDGGDFEDLRHNLALRERLDTNHGSYFDEVYIYQNVLRIHKAYTETYDLRSFKTSLEKMYLPEEKKSLVALMFDPRDKNVASFPDFGWMPLGTWNNSR